MDFTVTIDKKEQSIFDILDALKRAIEEYEQKYQEMLDILMENDK